MSGGHRLGQGRWTGYVDVEVPLSHVATRDEVVAAAEAAVGGRPFWCVRTRVTNLGFRRLGHWGVRFYR